jgi:hypothetical protein
MTATSRGLSLRFENVSRIRCLVEAVLMPERMMNDASGESSHTCAASAVSASSTDLAFTTSCPICHEGLPAFGA